MEPDTKPADYFTWNQPHAIERKAILRFLQEAEKRLAAKPELAPTGEDSTMHLTINWLRALIDRKPSEIET